MELAKRILGRVLALTIALGLVSQAQGGTILAIKDTASGKNGRGWLTVRVEPQQNPNIDLPASLRVELTNRDTKGGREYFVIREGQYNGRSASVRIPAANEGYGNSFLTPIPFTNPYAVVILHRKSNTLWYGTSDNPRTWTGPFKIQPLNAYIPGYPPTPPPLGTFFLEIPALIKDDGRPYLDKTVYSTSWFRINADQADGDRSLRYLHPGTRSAGCVTVTNPDIVNWNQIYTFLINSRWGDRQNVGIIKILDD